MDFPSPWERADMMGAPSKEEYDRLNALENFNGICPVCLSQMKLDEEKNEWICPKCTFTVPHFPITIRPDTKRIKP